jgi:hypothetical protein
MKNLILITTVATLIGCGGDSSNNAAPADAEIETETPTLVFELRATNLTAGQPLSPLAVFLHSAAENTFTVGEAASEALEQLAEGGDNAALVAQFNSLANSEDENPLPPGASTTLTLEVQPGDSTDLALSAVTMLVNSNDAFTAVNGIDISTLAVGESLRMRTPSYDSGTEANSEAAGTIPGPADGGEGFNAVRDDVADRVTMHGGVVTVNDGLASSVLGQQHRWDNPVASFSISRIQ